MKPNRGPALTFTKRQLLSTGALAVKTDLIHAVERAQREGNDHIVVIVKV